MKVVVLQSNYFPWRGYFQLVKHADLFVFYDEVKYTKNDWRNRNQIASKTLKRWITISVSGPSTKLKISEVKLDFNPKWRESHLNLIAECYENCEFYQTQVEPIIGQLIKFENNSLSVLNQHLIVELSRIMGLKAKFVNSAELNLEEGKVNRLIATLKQVGATEYLSGPAAKQYLSGSEKLFADENIKLTFHEYKDIKAYPCPHTLYSPDLSIIDLFANVSLEKMGDYF